MTYNPGIPNANQLISASQQPIKDNFGQLNAQFGIDHNAFNTGSGNGDGHHKQVFFDIAAASNTPALPTTPSGSANSVMYSAPDATSTNQEMFWANKQFNGATAVQVTNSALLATAGNGMLPGGLQIRCGNSVTGSANNVTFTPPFSAPPLALVATAQGGPASMFTSGVAANQATVSASGTQAFYWIAIGY